MDEEGVFRECIYPRKWGFILPGGLQIYGFNVPFNVNALLPEVGYIEHDPFRPFRPYTPRP